MHNVVPLSQFNASSRTEDTILCYEDRYSMGLYKTWGDFLRETAEMRRIIRTRGTLKWMLHCEDCWLFLVSFTALLQCGRHILLTANISPSYIADIRPEGAEFLSDQGLADSIDIRAELAAAAGISAAEAAEAPPIDADNTHIVLYTSGSTGKPKAVPQRLTEFEMDNAFVLSKWGREFEKRKLCSTVSQHHIYGLLFSVMLPFTAALPFRRKRINFPEEFEKLTDDSYMIIAVPSFLKRAVEIEGPGDLKLREPWIFTSGGVLLPETAEKTAEIFGFWPVEVYGSTETSGIAYRQSKYGLRWTPFDNAQIRVNRDGCLVIISPYIKDPAGFITGDLAEIYEDGSFTLKGRADSIVKIEEKRISLPEVEARILQSGLAAEVSVIALEDRRQYLAAAIVLNAAGKEKFRGLAPGEISRFFREYLSGFFEILVLPKKWRYPDALPMDTQGKKKKNEIEALFKSPNGHGLPAERVLERTDTSVCLELLIPGGCDYFDGHFPGDPLLPGAAQTDICVRLASRYLGTGLSVTGIKRIKFLKPIRPDSLTVIRMAFRQEELSLSFTMEAPDGGVYSSGLLTMGAEA